MANSLSGGGFIFNNIPVPAQPSRGGLTVTSGPGSGRFTTQGNVPPYRDPVLAFLAHSMEPIVRPAVPDKAYRLLDRLLAKRPKSGELPEASALWGQASDFTVEELKPPEKPTGGGISVNDPDNDQPEPEPAMVEWTEIERETIITRVTNPQDSTQYVDVEDATVSVFELPNGVRVRMTFLQRS